VTQNHHSFWFCITENIKNDHMLHTTFMGRLFTYLFPQALKLPQGKKKEKNPMSCTKKHPDIIANPHSWSGLPNSVEGNWGGNGKGERNPLSQ
jgi:hypothetical protein